MSEKFHFGDAVIGLAASEDNPRKHGFFVRRFQRTGRVINPGWHIEVTDGKGDFWTCHESNVARDADHLADRAELVRLIENAARSWTELQHTERCAHRIPQGG